jgi:hypothetical protein
VLVRCRVTSHGLSLRLERGGGVSAGLLHFPAGNAARWRGRERAWLFRGRDLNRSYAALSRPAVSPPRPRNRHPQKCSSAADTPAAASRRRIVTRRRTACRGPARRSGARRPGPHPAGRGDHRVRGRRRIAGRYPQPGLRARRARRSGRSTEMRQPGRAGRHEERAAENTADVNLYYEDHGRWKAPIWCTPGPSVDDAWLMSAPSRSALPEQFQGTGCAVLDVQYRPAAAQPDDGDARRLELGLLVPHETGQ